MTARLEGNLLIKPGTELTLEPDLGKLYIFDSTTGKRIV